MGFYNKATICLNGHTISSSEQNYSKFCKLCGSKTISLCEECNTPIKGIYEDDLIIDFFYNPPAYCDECGNAHPWTSQILHNAVELIALDDDIPDAHKEIIKTALPDIIIETPTTPVAVAKYKKFMNSAADYTKNGMKNLLIDAISDTVKKSIFG